MIRQNIYALDIVKGGQEGGKFTEIFVLVGDFRNEHMAYPDRFADVGQVPGAVENIVVAPPCQAFMVNTPYMFDIQKYGVGILHQFFKTAKPLFLPCERLRRGVQAGIYSSLFCLGEQFQKEIQLQQRLASTDGNSALVAPIITVTLCLVEQFVSGHQVVCPCRPGVRVVAKAASHVATLQEYHKAYARTVYRTECFYGMDVAF